MAKKTTRRRKKGVAIVKSSKGILLVSGKKRIFTLPGGGAKRGESRKEAASRELREETNLKSKGSKFLFAFRGKEWKDYKGQSVRNHTKVFLVNPKGRARPRNEVKQIAHWKPGSKLKISTGTKRVIKRYLEQQNLRRKR